VFLRTRAFSFAGNSPACHRHAGYFLGGNVHLHSAAAIAIVVLGALAFCHAAAPEAPRGNPTRFQAKSVTRTGWFRLSSTAERVFPLFGPVREKEWAEGWEPEVIYPLDAIAAEGMVFQVSPPGEPATVWILTRLDPARHEIVYYMVTPGVRVGKIQVRCGDNGDGSSTVNVSYTFTALSEAGNRYVEDFGEEKYAARMRHWEHAINYYLRTGQRAQHHE